MIQWFKGGITNICYNCLDANIAAGNGEKIAIYWEGNELGADATLTYNQLLHKVCQVFFTLLCLLQLLAAFDVPAMLTACKLLERHRCQKG